MVKGLLIIFLALLALAWFGYDIVGIASRGGTPTDENPVMSWFMTLLKLVMAVSLFISGFKALQKRD